MNRVAAVSAVMVAVLAGGDQCTEARKGSPEPAPGADSRRGAPGGATAPQPAEGDPKPPATSGNVQAIVRVRCVWTGRRWFTVTPNIGRELPTREVRWNVDGKSSDWRTGGGEYDSGPHAVNPGTVVGILCQPIPEPPERVNAFASCSVYHHGTVVDYQHVQSGSVACSYRVPEG